MPFSFKCIHIQGKTCTMPSSFALVMRGHQDNKTSGEALKIAVPHVDLANQEVLMSAQENMANRKGKWRCHTVHKNILSMNAKGGQRPRVHT